MWSIGGMIIDTAIPKYSERNLSQCQSVLHKSRLDGSGTEAGLPRCETDELRPEPWDGRPVFKVTQHNTSKHYYRTMRWTLTKWRQNVLPVLGHCAFKLAWQYTTRRQAWARLAVNLWGKKKDVEKIIHAQFVTVMWHVQNFTLV